MKSKRKRRELMLRLSHSMTQPMNFVPKERLTFVTQANALRRSAKDKLNDLVSLEKKLSSLLEKVKE